MGTSNKYSYEEHIEPRLQEIKWWLLDGVPRKEIYKRLGLTERTFLAILHSNAEFHKMFENYSAEADAKVRDSLFRRATGFEITEVVEDREVGERAGKPFDLVKTKSSTRVIPPDTIAQIFWLKNRQPGNWRDRRDHDVKAQVKITYNVDKIKKKKQDAATVTSNS